jgi:Rrf2 family iron-sulfur cluster assembly transcriptional regulator
MKLTTKGRYAVTAMMDLTLHSSHGRVVLTDIAERQHISLSYLEQLFAKLRRAGLVEGVRGPGGGYRLSRPSEEISVAEVVVAVDENMNLTCGNGDTCGGEEKPCLTHSLWVNLSDQLYGFLHGIKLGEIVDWPDVRRIADEQDVGRIANIPIYHH